MDENTTGKSVEDRLRECEQRLRDTQRLAGVGSWESSVEDGTMQWSEETYRIHGLTPGDPPSGSPELIEKSIACYPPEDRERITEAFAKCAEQGIPYDMTHRFVNAQGREMWIRTAAEPVWQGGRVVKVIGHIMDITDLKSAERTRRTSEERYHILNQSGVGFCIMQILFDAQGNPGDYRFIEANEAFEQHTGLRNAVGKTALELVPELEWSWIERYARVATTGKSERFIDGSEAMGRWFEVDAFRTGEPEDYHVALLFRDISERKKAEHRIEDLLEEKELVLKESHHRIKNNMSTIYSLLSLHTERLSDPGARNVLHEAAGQVRSMMLLYGKLYQSQTQQEASIREFLGPLIDDIVATYCFGNTVNTNVKLKDIPLNARTLSSLGIIMNELISNSMKYAFSGVDNPLISVSASRRESTVTITYSDNGIGLPESVTLERSEGFGMQLIAGLAQQIGGSVRIERGSGTRFIFGIDVSPVHAGEAHAEGAAVDGVRGDADHRDEPEHPPS